jgi:hypothetical protein
LAPQHEIFQKPFKVDIQYDMVPTPEEYRNRGLKPGDPLKVWHVQTKNFENDDVGPGVVSMGDGFTDSPDAEYIAGGINHKTPTAVAIGRQGPFFLWGFSAAPNDLTESGRRAFLNSVVYAAKFDRAPLLVHRNMTSRDRVPWLIGFLAAKREGHAAQVEVVRKFNQQLAAIREKAKTNPDTLTAREKPLAEIKDLTEMSYDQYANMLLSETRRALPVDVVKQCGDDAAKYAAWFKENRPYLYSTTSYHNEVDEDAKALGIPNSDLRILDACVESLERGTDTERAARLLRRYTGESFTTPAEWRAWLTGSRADLFFSDIGGYKFFSKAGSDAAHIRSVTAAAGEEPTMDQPVVLSAVVRPAAGTAGDTITIAVRMRIGPGWHTYAANGPEGNATVTRIEEVLPAGLRAVGAWKLPQSVPEGNGDMHYTDDVVFLREFKLEANSAGAIEIPLKVSYQACTRERCLPPASVKLTARVEPSGKSGRSRTSR